MNDLIEEKLYIGVKMLMLFYWVVFITMFIFNLIIIMNPSADGANRGF